ncbi:MAG: PQQ-dependent sugar dehydrogenase [Myxococcota bacterium]
MLTAHLLLLGGCNHITGADDPFAPDIDLPGLGTGDDDDDDDDATSTTAPQDRPLAGDLTMSKVSLFQGVEAVLMEDGDAPRTFEMPIIEDRPGQLRVFVDPDPSFDRRRVTAVLTITAGGDEETFEETLDVRGPSRVEDPGTTFDFDLDGSLFARDTEMHVELVEEKPNGPGGGTERKAVWDSAALGGLDLDTTDVLRIVLVPVRYNADGSGRLPDTSPAQLQRIEDFVMGVYPATSVEVSVHAPFDWNQPIGATSSSQWSAILSEMNDLRDRANEPPNTYYYGLFEPTSSIYTYCGSGCIAGLSLLAYNASDPYFRASVGIGWTGDVTAETLGHEVGHAHGRDHAPGGVTGDRNYPYPNARLGAWGFSVVDQEQYDPDRNYDMMSYCSPVGQRLQHVAPVRPHAPWRRSGWRRPSRARPCRWSTASRCRCARWRCRRPRRAPGHRRPVRRRRRARGHRHRRLVPVRPHRRRDDRPGRGAARGLDGPAGVAARAVVPSSGRTVRSGARDGLGRRPRARRPCCPAAAVARLPPRRRRPHRHLARRAAARGAAREPELPGPRSAAHRRRRAAHAAVPRAVVPPGHPRGAAAGRSRPLVGAGAARRDRPLRRPHRRGARGGGRPDRPRRGQRQRGWAAGPRLRPGLRRQRRGRRLLHRPVEPAAVDDLDVPHDRRRRDPRQGHRSRPAHARAALQQPQRRQRGVRPRRHAVHRLRRRRVGRRPAGQRAEQGRAVRQDPAHRRPRGSPYGIPPDNPFAAGGGRPEIYAWGLRNPWRFSVDPASGDLWVGDVGQDAVEEIDVVRRGGNYGWKIMEGDRCYGAAECDPTGLTLPVAVTTHDDGDASVTGGVVYAGQALPSLQGTYVFADYGSGRLYGLVADPVSGEQSVQTLLETGLSVVHIGTDAAGELVLVDRNTGLYRVDPAGPAPAVVFPERLSETGCFDAADPNQPLPMLIGYDVAHPFWSDAAGKARWLAIPDGTAITVDDRGELVLPIGSVAVKEFTIGQRKVETRLLVRHADGAWAGYTYAWDDAGSDAVLLAAGGEALGGAWAIPSRQQCLQCHTLATGGSLGLSLQQLDVVGPRGDNQVDELERLGMLDRAGAPRPGPFPPLDGDAPVEQRARTYLDVNCSFCHFEGGTGGGQLDLRHDVPLAQTGLCEPPQEGDLGLDAPRIVTPGDPAQSVLSLRIRSRDAVGMPPLASVLVDEVGADLVDAWITELASCP